MLKISYTSQFKKDLKKAVKRGKNISKLHVIADLLQNEKPLPEKNCHHKLTGDYIGHWECHIEPDWLLIYLRHKPTQELVFVRTGTHSDLF